MFQPERRTVQEFERIAVCPDYVVSSQVSSASTASPLETERQHPQMIASTSTAVRLFIDQNTKRAVEGALSAATEVTKARMKRASERTEKSPFKDCGDCGFDLRSEAERQKGE